MHHRGYNILWLDGHIDKLRPYVKQLAGSGHRVTEVSTCEDAAKLLNKTRYDAVILDVILERDAWTQLHGTMEYDEYGIDMLRYIRDQTPNSHTPVLIFSVITAERVRVLAKGLAFNASMSKATATARDLRQSVLEMIARQSAGLPNCTVK